MKCIFTIHFGIVDNDLERLISRISYRSANPRDLIAFRQSLSMLPHIKYLLKSCEKSKLCNYGEELDELQDVFELIEASIVDEPPKYITFIVLYCFLEIVLNLNATYLCHL